MKWKVVVGGAVLGLGWGIVMLVVAYAEAPSMPGSFELAIQLFMLGMLATLGAAGGLVVGWLAGLIWGRKNTTGRQSP